MAAVGAAAVLVSGQPTLAQSVSGQSVPRVHVDVLGECVEPSQIESFVTERAVGEAVVSVEVQCASEVRAHIRVEAGGGTSERSLVVSRDELGDLAEAIAVVVSVAIEGDVETLAEPTPQPAPSAADETDTLPVLEPAPVLDTAPAPRRAPSFELQVGASAAAGVFAEPVLGALVGVAWRLAPVAWMDLLVAVWMPQRVSFEPMGQVLLVPWSLRVGPCVVGGFAVDADASVEAGACASLWGGATGGIATDFEESSERWAPRVALSLRPRLGLLVDALLVRLELEGGVHLVSPSFYVLVDGVSRVYADRPGPLWAGVVLLVGARWAP